MNSKDMIKRQSINMYCINTCRSLGHENINSKKYIKRNKNRK